MDLDDEIITLISSDNVRYTLTSAEASLSKLIATALENDNETEIPLPSVHSEQLAPIVKFLKHHGGVESAPIEMPLPSSIISEVTGVWNANFIDEEAKKGVEHLSKLSMASNYMDINCLLHLCCVKFAALIKGKPMLQVMEILKYCAT
jgi:hypothetical protein